MSEIYTPDNLFAGHVMPKVTDVGTIAAGQNLPRGAVLGRVTADGKLKLVDKAATDGSQNVYAILAEATDATTADKVAPIYLTGEFNENALTLAAGTTVADIKASARAVGIFIKSAVKA
ncbi:head decoration protein [Carboxydothermus pertinax]|uniref:Head decoration protein n=1 Tax=Carboxydothermus pertinax TaxID=870242 RepID=A0A1L8CRQ4_9THEO|nr:head decoration protein [Carboxydothermus pertinax]GAV21602.1 head decoration protein [Carboxydothermus pertinax]